MPQNNSLISKYVLLLLVLKELRNILPYLVSLVTVRAAAVPGQPLYGDGERFLPGDSDVAGRVRRGLLYHQLGGRRQRGNLVSNLHNQTQSINNENAKLFYGEVQLCEALQVEFPISL